MKYFSTADKFCLIWVLEVSILKTPDSCDCKSFPLKTSFFLPRFCLRWVSPYLSYLSDTKHNKLYFKKSSIPKIYQPYCCSSYYCHHIKIKSSIQCYCTVLLALAVNQSLTAYRNLPFVFNVTWRSIYTFFQVIPPPNFQLNAIK